MTYIAYVAESIFSVHKDGQLLAHLEESRLRAIDADIATACSVARDTRLPVTIPSVARFPRPRNAKVYGILQ
jgi:hypothetical protein